MLHSIVGFDGFGLDDDGGVAVLVVLTAGCDGPRHVAARQPQRGAEGSEGCDKHRKDDFDDSLFGHRCDGDW